MEYKKIEHLAYNQNLIAREDYKTKKEYDLAKDKILVINLLKCIEKKIPIEMNEIEFAKIYKIYLKLLHNKYPIKKEFIFDIANLSVKKLDYLGIIQEITE